MWRLKPRPVKFLTNQTYEVRAEGSGLLRAFHELSQQTSIKLNVVLHAPTLTLFFFYYYIKHYLIYTFDLE